MLGCEKCDVTFDGKKVICESGENKDKCVTLADISTASMCGNDIALSVTNTHTSPISPPPFMVGAAEVEVDLLTGESRVVEYDACVDCGTPVNPNLARVQAEGGILQGIGMTMSENITYSDKGKLYENSFYSTRFHQEWILDILMLSLRAVTRMQVLLVRNQSERL